MIDWPAKSPSEIEDFAFDWSGVLAEGETIATKAVSGTGVTVASSAIEDSLVRVWLSGGAEGNVATVECTITTSGGRTFDEIAVLPIGGTAVGLAEAKRHLRVEHDEDDALIAAYLAAACDQVETLTGKILTPKMVSQSVNGFPCGTGQRGAIRLFKGPVQQIIAVAYDDGDGAEQALADYRLSEGDPAMLTPLAGQAFPVTIDAPASVRVRYLAGYAPGEMPAKLRAAVLLLLGHLYQNREAVMAGSGTAAVALPLGFEALVAPHAPVGIS